MRVALVYDRINKWGGAERVLLALHDLFPDAPLFTSIYHSSTAPWASKFKIKTSFLQKLSFIQDKHEYLASFMPVVFESFTFDEFDLVISVTSESAKGIITKPSTKHICYCLTPTRYLWSGYNDYFANTVLRVVAKPAVLYLREWDKQSAQRPDSIIAISHEVQKRIKNYYGRNSSVIYPPTQLSGSTSQLPVISKSIKNKKDFKKSLTGHFLIVSRLVPYKKIDIAIEACNELKIPLMVVGQGSEEKRLRSIAGKTITFTGAISDEELAFYYSSCKALIFTGLEDFGLVMVEAMSYGKPVIAYKAGGALEVVIENKTGVFFDSQNKNSLINALLKFESKKYSEIDCKNQAEKFSIGEFKKQFMQVIRREMEGIMV